MGNTVLHYQKYISGEEFLSRNFTTLARLGCLHNGSCNCILEMVTFAKVCARKMFLSFVRAYVTILSVGGREAGRLGGWEAGRLGGWEAGRLGGWEAGAAALSWEETHFIWATLSERTLVFTEISNRLWPQCSCSFSQKDYNHPKLKVLLRRWSQFYCRFFVRLLKQSSESEKDYILIICIIY